MEQRPPRERRPKKEGGGGGAAAPVVPAPAPPPPPRPAPAPRPAAAAAAQAAASAAQDKPKPKPKPRAGGDAPQPPARTRGEALVAAPATSDAKPAPRRAAPPPAEAAKPAGERGGRPRRADARDAPPPARPAAHGPSTVPAPAPAAAPRVVAPAPAAAKRLPAAHFATVQVPRELHRERLQAVGQRVFEELPVESVALQQDGFAVGAATHELLEQAQLMLETLLTQQLQLQRRFALKDRLAEDVERVKSEIDAGLRVEFSVDPTLLGMVIGAGGAHVRRVTEETGVDRVVVDREAGVVRIVGHRAADVARARAALEVCSVAVRVPDDKVGYIVGKEGKNINELQARSGATQLRLAHEGAAGALVRVLGSRAACDKARLLIEAQLAYLNEAEAEAKQVEDMKRQLEAMNVSWGEDSFLIMRGGGGGDRDADGGGGGYGGGRGYNGGRGYGGERGYGGPPRDGYGGRGGAGRGGRSSEGGRGRGSGEGRSGDRGDFRGGDFRGGEGRGGGRGRGGIQVRIENN